MTTLATLAKYLQMQISTLEWHTKLCTKYVCSAHHSSDDIVIRVAWLARNWQPAGNEKVEMGVKAQELFGGLFLSFLFYY